MRNSIARTTDGCSASAANSWPAERAEDAAQESSCAPTAVSRLRLGTAVRWVDLEDREQLLHRHATPPPQGAAAVRHGVRRADRGGSRRHDVLGDLLTAERAPSEGRGRSAAGTLSPPLVLAYYNDASYDDVAATLGITRTHAGTLFSARSKRYGVACNRRTRDDGLSFRAHRSMYVDGALPTETAAEVERHVAECSSCAELTAQLTAESRLLRRVLASAQHTVAVPALPHTHPASDYSALRSARCSRHGWSQPFGKAFLASSRASWIGSIRSTWAEPWICWFVSFCSSDKGVSP